MAIVQLLAGISAAIGIVIGLTKNHVNLDLNVLGIPMYYGLLRWSSGWRTCALVFCWAGMLLTPVAFLMGLNAEAPAFLKVFGVQVASLPAIWLSALSIAFFLLNLWQYRVLTRPDIRAAFLQSAREAPIEPA